MSARLFAFATLAALAVAGPLAARDGQCNTGSINCCNSIMPAGKANNVLEKVFGLVDVLTDLDGDVGIQCTPIAGNGAVCQQQSVCCSGNKVDGLVSVGCSPIDLGA